MRNFSEAIDDFDLIDRVYRGRQSAMYAKDLVIDNDGECQEVEHVGKVVPNVSRAVFARTFRVKAVGLSYAARFMVASNEMHARWIS